MTSTQDVINAVRAAHGINLQMANTGGGCYVLEGRLEDGSWIRCADHEDFCYPELRDRHELEKRDGPFGWDVSFHSNEHDEGGPTTDIHGNTTHLPPLDYWASGEVEPIHWHEAPDAYVHELPQVISDAFRSMPADAKQKQQDGLREQLTRSGWRPGDEEWRRHFPGEVAPSGGGKQMPDYEKLVNPRDDLDDDFGHIFGRLHMADLIRLAGDGMSWEDTMAHIDRVLAEGEPRPQEDDEYIAPPDHDNFGLPEGWQDSGNVYRPNYFYQHPSGLTGYVEAAEPGRAFWEIYEQGTHATPVASGGGGSLSDGEQMLPEQAMQAASDWIRDNHHRRRGSRRRTAAAEDLHLPPDQPHDDWQPKYRNVGPHNRGNVFKWHPPYGESHVKYHIFQMGGGRNPVRWGANHHGLYLGMETLHPRDGSGGSVTAPSYQLSDEVEVLGYHRTPDQAKKAAERHYRENYRDAPRPSPGDYDLDRIMEENPPTDPRRMGDGEDYGRIFGSRRTASWADWTKVGSDEDRTDYGEMLSYDPAEVPDAEYHVAKLEDGHELHAYNHVAWDGDRPFVDPSRGWMWSVVDPYEPDVVDAGGGYSEQNHHIPTLDQAKAKAETAYVNLVRGGLKGLQSHPNNPGINRGVNQRRDDDPGDYGHIFGSLDMADLVRLAGDGMSWEDTLKYIDETLAAGDPEPEYHPDGRRHWPTDWDARTAPLDELYYAYHSDRDEHGNEGPHVEHAWEELKRRYEDEYDQIGDSDTQRELARWYRDHSGLFNDDDDGFSEVEDPQAHQDFLRQVQERTAGWADDNPAFDDIMKHIDDQLAAGEPGNPSDEHTYRSNDYTHPNGEWLHPRDIRPGDLVSWSNGGRGRVTRVNPPFEIRPGKTVGGWSLNFDGGGSLHAVDRVFRHIFSSRTAAPAQDPAAMAPVVPAAGGYLPAHRVGLDWRDNTIPGTVIGLDGDTLSIRWDDGQYTSEDPSEVHLL